MEKIFYIKLEDALKNKSNTFFFPIKVKFSSSSDNIIYSETLNFICNVPEEYTWYKIIINVAAWKGIPSYNLQFYEKNDIKIDQFCNDYIELINKEYEKCIDHLESLCISMNANHNVNKVVNSNFGGIKSPNLIKRENLLNKGNQVNAYNKLSEYSGKSKDVCILRENSNVMKPIQLYLLKYQFNFIYDSYLTVSVFKQLKEKIKDFELYELDPNALINYLIDNFALLTKMKRFKIKYSYNFKNEIQINYPILRVIIFNIIMFILNTSQDNNEKQLTIRMQHDKFVGSGLGSYYKLIFSITNNNMKTIYSKIAEIFAILKTKSIDELNIELLNCLDLGMVTVFYIITDYYKCDFIIKESQFEIKFIAEGDNKNDRGLNSKNEKNKKVKIKKQDKLNLDILEEDSINKILLRIFKFDPVKNNKVDEMLEELKLKDMENTDEEDFYNMEEHSEESVLNDTRIYEKTRNTLNIKNLNYGNYLIKRLDSIPKIITKKKQNIGKGIDKHNLKEIMEINRDSSGSDRSDEEDTSKNIERRFSIVDIMSENKEKISKSSSKFTLNKSFNLKIQKFDDSQNKSSLKAFNAMFPLTPKQISIDRKLIYSKNMYCNPPRILIVEDNVFGTKNLINILKNNQMNCIVETDEGQEAFERFKFLFNSGLLYDLIFMDINLTESISGIDITNKIRKYESITPNIRTTIIAVTADVEVNNDNKLFDEICKINFIL